MELRQLSTFIQVAQLKSFSRAAESLGYSQSAVTVQIRQLEEELDTRLFDRIGKHISLTARGVQFLEHAYDVLQEVNKARLSVSDTGELHGRLHIGTIESLCFSKLPAVLHAYWQRHPKVVVHVTTGSNNWNKLMERKERVVFVTSASLGAELEGIPELTVEDLLDRPFYLTERDTNYRRVLDRFLAARDRSLTPFLECSDTSFLIRILENNQGISLLPWYAVEQSVGQGKLSLIQVADFHVTLYRQIFSHKEKWCSREMDEFVRVVNELEGL